MRLINDESITIGKIEARAMELNGNVHRIAVSIHDLHEIALPSNINESIEFVKLGYRYKHGYYRKNGQHMSIYSKTYPINSIMAAL